MNGQGLADTYFVLQSEEYLLHLIKETVIIRLQRHIMIIQLMKNYFIGNHKMQLRPIHLLDRDIFIMKSKKKISCFLYENRKMIVTDLYHSCS